MVASDKLNTYILVAGIKLLWFFEEHLLVSWRCVYSGISSWKRCVWLSLIISDFFEDLVTSLRY